MKNRILVFEDDSDNFEQLANPLKDEINQDKYEIDHFEGDESNPKGEDDSEFVKQLLKGKNENYPVIVVLDAELNEYTSSTVRRADVRDACGELGIPLCVYHRDDGEYANPESVKESDDQIIQLVPLERGHTGMAKDCAAIVEGFAEIHTHLEERMDDAKPEDLLEPPSEFIKDMDNVPISAKPNLDKYSWGQSESLAVITEEESKSDAIRRKSTILGYWLVNQVLKYPGVLANSVAAASFLGVDHEEFQEREDIRSLFEEARYEGPFSNLRDWWWTSELDSILSRNTTPEDGSTISGQEFLSREGIDINPVECLEGHSGAGYYCVLKQEPVCEEHSVSPEAWIPAGASLTRISEDEYMKLSGW